MRSVERARQLRRGSVASAADVMSPLPLSWSLVSSMSFWNALFCLRLLMVAMDFS